MADNLHWTIGDVTITRVVESVAHIPPAGCCRARRRRRDRVALVVAAAALRRRRRQPRAVDPRVRHHRRRPQDHRRHLHRQRPSDPGHGGAQPADAVPHRPRRRRLPARGGRHGDLHPPPLRPRGLEHDARRRRVGADVPERALPPLPRRVGALESAKAATGYAATHRRRGAAGDRRRARRPRRRPTTRSPTRSGSRPRPATRPGTSRCTSSRAGSTRSITGDLAHHPVQFAEPRLVRRPRHRPRAVGGHPSPAARRARRHRRSSSSAPTSRRRARVT